MTARLELNGAVTTSPPASAEAASQSASSGKPAKIDPKPGSMN
ncbi:hypothetical protein [Mesorhizobium sp. B2-3-4]|nr:hypothetical protein [Mesorhizobium sp. B2-3-4]